MNRALLRLACAAIVGALLWRSAAVRDYLVQSPRAKRVIERLAGDRLEAHRRGLGRLGYFEDRTWTPFSGTDLARRHWPEKEAFLRDRVTYEPVAAGVDVGALTVKHENGASFDIVIVVVDPDTARFRVLVNDEPARQRAYVKEMAAASQAVAAINGGFFDGNGALGLVLQAGRELRPANRSPGYFVVQNGTPRVYNERSPGLHGAREGLQSGPVLIAGGTVHPRNETGKVARRSAVGRTRDRRILLVSTDVHFGGLTMQQLATVLGALGVRDALALDGGGSAQLYVSGRGHQVVGWDPVPVALGVFAAP